MRIKENLLDHNPTVEELTQMVSEYGSNTPEKMKAYLDRITDEEYNERTIVFLYRLYDIRGNEQMKKHYFDMLPDDVYKWFSVGNYDYDPSTTKG